MSETPQPMTEAEMLRHATRAVAKIDRAGTRGATLVTMEETIAMAALIVVLIARSGGPLLDVSDVEGAA